MKDLVKTFRSVPLSTMFDAMMRVAYHLNDIRLLKKIFILENRPELFSHMEISLEKVAGGFIGTGDHANSTKCNRKSSVKTFTSKSLVRKFVVTLWLPGILPGFCSKSSSWIWNAESSLDAQNNMLLDFIFILIKTLQIGDFRYSCTKTFAGRSSAVRQKSSFFGKLSG